MPASWMSNSAEAAQWLPPRALRDKRLLQEYPQCAPLGGLLWSSQEESYVLRELIRRVGVLQASTGGKHKMVVFVEVVDGAEIESRAVVSIYRVGGLMEYFPTYGKFVAHLSLEQHAREPKILVTCTALVDPIPATGIDGRFAETLLRPDREKPQDVACSQPTALVTAWQLNEGEDGNLRSPTMLILLNEPVFKADRHVAETELNGVIRRAVERDRCVDRELAIRDETVIQFKRRQTAGRIAAHNCSGRKCVELVVTEWGRFGVVGAVGRSGVRSMGCQAPQHR